MSVSSKKVWVCEVGSVDDGDVPPGADASMRQAVRQAYFEQTGRYPDAIFSGWPTAGEDSPLAPRFFNAEGPSAR